jgi:phospholipid/cholesterol/gamma-HCH transport system substrate-binding protein
VKPLRERNQVTVAIVGSLLIAGVILASLNLDKLPFVNRSVTYHAEFAAANGLAAGNDVRVAGVSVGKVGSVKVDGDRVRVDFTVRPGLKLGTLSAASIEVATVLGNVFLQVESAGPAGLAAGATIPLARTTVPYTLVTAFSQLGAFTDQTDLPTLRDSFATLAATLDGIAPADAKAALRGLADVSRTLAAKQQQVQQILDAATTLTDTLNAKSTALVHLLTQSDAFLALLQQRHDVVARLLRDTATLGAELSKIVKDNSAQLEPMLANLRTVTDVLARQKAQLQQAVINLGEFSVNISNATGSGPGLDLLSPVAVTPDNVIRACGPNPDSAKGPCG